MYNIVIDDEKPPSFPCYYLACIVDFDFTKNTSIDGGYKNLPALSSNNNALIFAKFKGKNYACNNAYIFRHIYGITLMPVDTRQGYSFISSAFWNFKLYVFLPVTADDLGGYGIATFNSHGKPVYIQSSTHNKYYAEGFKLGDVGANRLYLSSFYKIDANENVYYYASKSDGSLVTMQMKVNKQNVSTHYHNNAPIISINAVPTAVEHALKASGQYIYIR